MTQHVVRMKRSRTIYITSCWRVSRLGLTLRGLRDGSAIAIDGVLGLDGG